MYCKIVILYCHDEKKIAYSKYFDAELLLLIHKHTIRDTEFQLDLYILFLISLLFRILFYLTGFSKIIIILDGRYYE